MKFNVKFAPHATLSFGTARTFHGEGAVHLHETGLVVEGDFPKFTIPFITSYYAPLLCAGTSRTVPYSRVAAHRCSAITLGRILFLVFFGLLAVGGTFMLLGLSLVGGDVVVPLVVVWAAFLVVVVLLVMTGRWTHVIVYRLPSGASSASNFDC